MKIKTELFEDFRWNKRWTKRQMARHLDLSPESYQYLLKGEFRNLNRIDGLAKKIGLKPIDILE